jgi:hypothetical protein
MLFACDHPTILEMVEVMTPAWEAAGNLRVQRQDRRASRRGTSAGAERLVTKEQQRESKEEEEIKKKKARKTWMV